MTDRPNLPTFRLLAASLVLGAGASVALAETEPDQARAVTTQAPYTATSTATSAATPTMTTVFDRGEDGYHTFRIPAVVETVDDTLLAFAEGRVENPSDNGDIDLVLKRSTDGGATWGPLQVVADDGPNKWGNPVPIVDRTTSRVILNTTRTGGDVTGDDIQCGRADADELRRSFIQYSDDAGRTWSEPTEITDDVRPADWRHFVGGPGHGIQLTQGEHAGRLVIPGNHSHAPPAGSGRECSDGRDSGGHSLYSDDGGATWHLGGVDEPGDGVLVPNETAAVELGDGTIYFSSRDQGSSPGQRLDTTSSDGGASFDDPYDPVDGVVTSRVQGSLLRLPAGRGAADRVLLSVPGHPTAREDMTLWSSFDGSTTWGRSITVYDGPSGYSDLVQLGERPGRRDVGVLFENGDRLHDESALPYHHRISFARVPEHTLDRPAPPPSLTPDTSGNGHDARVDGEPRRVSAPSGRGFELAGDYVELPAADGLDVGTDPFTAAAWFRTDRDANQAVFWAYSRLTADPKWWIRLEPGAGRVRALLDDGDTARFVAAPGDVADGDWHHVALTRDNDTATLYVDGMPAASADAPAGSLSAGARTGIRVGARVDGINDPLVGGVDEVRIYDRALSADEVADLADLAGGAGPEGAVAHLPLDRVQGVSNADDRP